MSTVTTMAARGDRAVRVSPVAALVASARAELLRLRRWPALWVMIGVWLLLTLTFTYLFNYISYATESTNFATENVTDDELLADMLPEAIPRIFTTGMPMFGAAIMMTLGALATGSGYGWGTWKTAMTQRPGRLSTFGGTLVALMGVVLAVVTATFLLDLGVSTLIAGVEAQSITWPALGDLARSFGGGLMIFGLWAMAGALIGVLTRSPALAIGLGLVWSLVIENLLRGVAEALSGLEYVTDYLPGTAAGSLAGALGAGTGSESDGAPGVLDVLGGSTATLVVTAYLVACVVVASMIIRHRDVV